MNNEKILKPVCKICNHEFLDNNGLVSHINKKHNITSKEYYDMFFKKPGEGICPVCGKPTKYGRISTGYQDHCSIECISKDEKIKKQKEEHYKITYGEEYTSNLQLPNVIKQIKKTKKELYGDENYNNRKQAQETCKEKYGTEHPLQNINVKEKAYKTCKERHGSEHCFRNLYVYDNITFDSKWELIYYIWLKDHNINFEYHPNLHLQFNYLNEIKYYYPDFLLLDENKIIELKGTQFFLNKNPNERMICSYNRKLDDLYEAKHQCMIQNNVVIITDISLYENYINLKYGKNYLKSYKKEKRRT